MRWHYKGRKKSCLKGKERVGHSERLVDGSMMVEMTDLNHCKPLKICNFKRGCSRIAEPDLFLATLKSRGAMRMQWKKILWRDLSTHDLVVRNNDPQVSRWLSLAFPRTRWIFNTHFALVRDLRFRKNRFDAIRRI